MIVPPSVHPSGQVYTWKHGQSPFDLNPAFAPRWIWQSGAVEKQDWTSLVGDAAT